MAVNYFFRHITFFRGICGQQLFHLCGILFARLWRILQDPQQIAVRIQAVLLRRFDQAVDHGAGLRAAGCIGKQPVLSAHHKGLDAPLGREDILHIAEGVHLVETTK